MKDRGSRKPIRVGTIKINIMKGIEISTESTNEIKRELIPSGTHIARCYSMIHIGNVHWEWQGEQKVSNKIRLTFELPNEMRDFGGEMKPMVISKEYTLSLHEKSNLRKDLESWRGEAFSGSPRFDVTDMLGKECMLGIMHKTGKTGNEYATISSISKLANGMTCPEQFNPDFIFNYHDNFNQEWLNEQPEWVQNQIKETDDYKSKMNNLKHNGSEKEDLPF